MHTKIEVEETIWVSMTREQASNIVAGIVKLNARDCAGFINADVKLAHIESFDDLRIALLNI